VVRPIWNFWIRPSLLNQIEWALAIWFQVLSESFGPDQALCTVLSVINIDVTSWHCGWHRDDSLRNSELTSKLEPAFLGGLRCSQPHIRQKFMEVFDASIRRRLYDRLLYIVSSQNWESMVGHFWIKQCIEVRYCFHSLPWDWWQQTHTHTVWQSNH